MFSVCRKLDLTIVALKPKANIKKYHIFRTDVLLWWNVYDLVTTSLKINILYSWTLWFHAEVLTDVSTVVDELVFRQFACALFSIHVIWFWFSSLQAIYKLQHLVDINDIYSNDIHAMARTYGIEAARVVLINVRRFWLSLFHSFILLSTWPLQCHRVITLMRVVYKGAQQTRG